MHSRTSESPDPGSLSLSIIFGVSFPTARLPALAILQAVLDGIISSQRDRPRTPRYVARTSSSLSLRGPMALRDGADDEFEFLLNFLASDGVNPDPNPGPPRGTAAGSRKGGEDDRSLRIQMGSDGKLDLGQVKAFYEGKNVRAGKGPMTDGPGFTDHSRNHPGLFFLLRMLCRTSSPFLYSVRICHSTPPVAPDDM